MSCHTLGRDQELALEGGGRGAYKFVLANAAHPAPGAAFDLQTASRLNQGVAEGLCAESTNGSDQESALEEVGGLSWGAFKPLLADAVIAHLAPLQQRYADVMADPGYLDQVRHDAPHQDEFGWIGSGMQGVC